MSTTPDDLLLWKMAQDSCERDNIQNYRHELENTYLLEAVNMAIDEHGLIWSSEHHWDITSTELCSDDDLAKLDMYSECDQALERALQVVIRDRGLSVRS